jgi:hypothetical protein
VEAGVGLSTDVPGEPGDVPDACHSDVSFRLGASRVWGDAHSCEGHGCSFSEEGSIVYMDCLVI